MKKIFSTMLVALALGTGCSSGTGEKQPAADSTTVVSANDSLDAHLKKAEELVKDDTTTNPEENF